MTMLQTLLLTAAVGAGATLVLDLWSLLLKRLGIPVLDFALLGRWIGHLRQGRWFHERIAAAAPVRGERWIGWCLHYAIGMGFAAVLVSAYGVEWLQRPTPLPALIVGIATSAAPLFLLQPALGAGIASSKTPKPLFNSLKSVLSHAVFGTGLYLAAVAAASIR
jgi:hypothetical protein